MTDRGDSGGSLPRAVRTRRPVTVSLTHVLSATIVITSSFGASFGLVQASSPDGVYVNGFVSYNPPCPVSDLPNSLTDPAALGEWVVMDELCYESFPRRKATTTGKYVLWKENFKGRQPHLTQTAEDPYVNPAGDNRVAGGVVSMAMAHSACCDGVWMRGMHLEDTYGRSDACVSVTREYHTTSWKIKKVTDDVRGRAGTHGVNPWIAEFNDDGSLLSFWNRSGDAGGYWRWTAGEVFLANGLASDLPIAVQMDRGSLGFEYPYERTFPPPRIVTPASTCNPSIAISSSAYRTCVENLLVDNAAGKIKIAIVPLYFTTSDVTDVDTAAVASHFAGGADSTKFATWWREGSFGRQNDIELVVLDPVPVNLPEWVSDADASSLHNARRTSTACKAEIATYGADSVGFASEDLRTANSVCSQSSDCVRHAWKWDYTRCDGNCKVYGWEDVEYSADYTCVDLVGKSKPGDSSSTDVAMTGVQLRANANAASGFYGLTDDTPAYKCVEDTNFMSTNQQHLTGRVGDISIDPSTYHRVVWSTWRTRCSGYGGSGHYRLHVSDVGWKEFGSSMTVGTTTFASLNGGISQNDATPSRLDGESANSAYATPKGAVGTFIHELVHSFGVNNHARACVNDVTNHLGVGEYGFFNLPCRTTEYGSWMSIMGKNAGTSATHVHAGTMYDMHLLHLTDVHVIKSSGTYTIKPLNSLTTTGGTDKRAAVVQFTDQHVDTATADWTKIAPPIWAEFRVASGVDVSLGWDEYAGNTDGVILNWGHQYGDVLLDLDYGTPSFENSLADVSLKPGASYRVNHFLDGSICGTVTFSNVVVANDKSSVTFSVTYAATSTGGGDIETFYAGSAPWPHTKYADYPLSTVSAYENNGEFSTSSGYSSIFHGVTKALAVVVAVIIAVGHT